MKTNLSNYKKDKYYPRVVKAIGQLLLKSDEIIPVEVMIEMGNLKKDKYEDWRRGQVPSIEKIFEGNLSKENRILRIIGFHAHDLNMIKRPTVYKQWGKEKKRTLKFSKYGEPRVEASYSTHFILNQSKPKKIK